MAKVIVICILTYVVTLAAMLREPFPSGAIMATLGTIIDEKGATGYTPWISSAYVANNRLAGIAVSATTFYDAMDNYADRSLVLVNGGGVISGRWYAGKIAISHYDALGAYFEQSGYISCAATLFGRVRCALDLTGTRIGLTISDTRKLTLGEVGCTVVVPVQPVYFIAALQNVTVKSAQNRGADPSLVARCGIFTAQHAFGAQGVLITVTPDYPHPVSFIIGQELQLHKRLVLDGAIGSNPLLLSFGVTVTFGHGTVSSALVDHPVLGWSRGIAAGYDFRIPDATIK